MGYGKVSNITLSKSDTLKQFLENEGAYDKLPAKQKEGLIKGFLVMRGYAKGRSIIG